MQITRELAKGQVVALNFMQDNLAASQTDVQLFVAEVAAAAGIAVDAVTMPWAGEIIAISYATSAAATAGTLTIGATINGTEAADPTLTVTTGTGGSDTAKRGTARFAAGDKIGAEITTNGSWDGTTADLVATVWVAVELAGI